MSHYVECLPGFNDRVALVDALVAVGFERDQIEIHDEPVALYGYQGDLRPQQANIVIRRQHIGPAANDVGWERMFDGTYRAWISEYDGRHRFNAAMQGRIKQEYAFTAVATQQQAMGRSVTRRNLENGEIEVLIGGYR